MPTGAQYATEDLGYLGYITESIPNGSGTPGTFVTPNIFLPWKANSLDAVPDMVKGEYVAGSRASLRALRTAKSKIGGGLTHDLFANVGVHLIVAGLGGDAVTTVVSDTVKVATPIVTAAGISTITLTTGSGFTAGAFVTVNTAANQEIRPILTYDSGTGVITVPALVINAAGAAGIAVAQPVQHQIALSKISSGYGNQLRTVSLESNEGGLWSWQFAGCYVDKLTVKGGKDTVEVMEAIEGTIAPVKPGSPTSFSTDANWATDTQYPFDIIDGYISVTNDPTASGTSTLQINPSLESFELGWDNGGILTPTWDGKTVYKYVPGKATATVKYEMLNPSQRWAEYEDLLKAEVATPFHATMTQNRGTPSSPTWAGYNFYAPSVRVVKATPKRALGQIIGASIEGEIRNSGVDMLTVFALDRSVTSY